MQLQVLHGITFCTLHGNFTPSLQSMCTAPTLGVYNELTSMHTVSCTNMRMAWQHAVDKTENCCPPSCF